MISRAPLFSALAILLFSGTTSLTEAFIVVEGGGGRGIRSIRRPSWAGTTRWHCQYYRQHHEFLDAATAATAFAPLKLLSKMEDGNDYNDDDNKTNNNNDGDDEDSSSFYRDFQQAKTSKLGASIPKEQLQESAAQAESDFLQAMKETQEDFSKAKAEMGADAAVDMLLDRLRQEDEHNNDGDEEVKESSTSSSMVGEEDYSSNTTTGAFEWSTVVHKISISSKENSLIKRHELLDDT